MITAPKVFIIGSTQFDHEGLEAWVQDRGFRDDERFEGSPLQNILNGGVRLTEEQSDAELLSELAGRFCYNSMMKGRSSQEYLKNVIEMQHGSVLEHVTFNMIIEGVSRSLTHELIRHRAGFAPSQESQRYVDAKDINFVVPPLLLFQCNDDLNHPRIIAFMERCERELGFYIEEQQGYMDAFEAEAEGLGKELTVKDKTLLKKRANEAARSVLPNAAETRLTWTGNLRALRHLFELRGDTFADLEIRRLACAMADKIIDKAPYTFFDTEIRRGDYGVNTIAVGHHKV